MKTHSTLAVMALLLAGCATTGAPPAASGGAVAAIPDGPAPKNLEFLTFMGRATGKDLADRIAKASHYPLGTAQNPIRVDNPPGQMAYLRRLRCSDGSAPSFVRTGNLGPGVFGSIVDNYRVTCARGEPKVSNIVMDMYFPEHHETAPPPGFTIVR